MTTPDTPEVAGYDLLPPVGHALTAILRKWKFKSHHVLGRDNSREASKRRRIVARELRAMGYTVEKIGEAICRHHSTVLYLLGRIDQRHKRKD